VCFRRLYKQGAIGTCTQRRKALASTERWKISTQAMLFCPRRPHLNLSLVGTELIFHFLFNARGKDRIGLFLCTVGNRMLGIGVLVQAAARRHRAFLTQGSSLPTNTCHKISNFTSLPSLLYEPSVNASHLTMVCQYCE
jgi:hypothetical protein